MPRHKCALFCFRCNTCASATMRMTDSVCCPDNLAACRAKCNISCVSIPPRLRHSSASSQLLLSKGNKGCSKQPEAPVEEGARQVVPERTGCVSRIHDLSGRAAAAHWILELPQSGRARCRCRAWRRRCHRPPAARCITERGGAAQDADAGR